MTTAITGTICSGKSHVRQCFAALEQPTLDVDQLAYRLYNPYNPENNDLVVKDGLYLAIVNHFGQDVVDHKKEYKPINNPRLREVCMADAKELEAISIIANHYLLIELTHIISRDPGLYVEAAMLFEYGWQDLFDQVIVVASDHQAMVERLMARLDVSKDYAENWISSQMPQDEKIKRGDIVIWNDQEIPADGKFTGSDPLFVICREILGG